MAKPARASRASCPFISYDDQNGHDNPVMMMMKNTVMMVMMVMMISLMVVTDEDHCTVCLHRVIVLVNVRIAHLSIAQWGAM